MNKKRTVYKFGTGDVIPDGAVYLETVVQTEIFVKGDMERYGRWEKCYLVWHYFLCFKE